ncbi:MAG: nucleotidyltransferase domain-containing protein [Chloroflexi bacterium]|nr:nucleotidyltransferase domain-containing protein [Chloroflexota bacterium]
MHCDNSTLDRIASAFRDDLGDNLIAVVLFGSRARGEARPGSDFDIFIVAKDLPHNFLERMEFLHRPRITVTEGVSVRGKTQKEFESSLRPLYLDIALDGKILFDTDGYMEEKLRRIREIMKEAGLSRIKEQGELMWVWERQPKPGAWELEWGGLFERA